MYYYKSKNFNPKTLTQKLLVDSLKEAKQTIKNIGKNPNEFDFFTEDEKNVYEENNRVLTQKELWSMLSPEATMLLKHIFGNVHLTKEMVNELVPKEQDVYFIWCHLDDGFKCSFGTHKDVEETYIEKTNASEYEAFDVNVYSFRNGIKECEVEVNLSVTIK